MTIGANDSQRLAQLRAEVAAVEAAMREVVKDVVLLHKRAGQPLVVWRDGGVVLIPPDQIPTDDNGLPQ